MQRFPMNIAHRGASTIAPENTLLAFQKAIEAGVDGIITSLPQLLAEVKRKVNEHAV